MTIGRPNKGLGHVESLDADDVQKDRLRTILATISGEMSVNDACAHLGISRARFAELRNIALQSACDGLVPGRPGRPRKHDPERDAEIDELEAEIARLDQESQNAWIKAGLALAMPGIIAEYEKRGAAARRRRSEGTAS